jgi:NAD(P)-dependent dehydrogenase (short-subunit alcohol dehydrogenase family)
MLKDRVAIVTGAGRGIGRAIALLMAEKGASVVVNDLGVAGDGTGGDAGPAQDVVAEILNAGGKAIANTDSVASADGCANMVKSARDAFGKLDIVVNNAGILRDRMFHKMDPADWQAVMDVHVGGHFHLCRAAINQFREQEYGRIVNFTSTSGLIGNIGQTNYGAAKMAIMGLTRLLALETQRYDICVNAVSPFAWTRMTSSIPVNDEKAAQRVEKLKRMKPENIAPLVVYLASEQAKGVTGQIFGARAGELMIFSTPKPLRSVHHSGGWTPEEVGEIAIPALRNFFSPVMPSAEMFPYDPLD